MTPYALEFLGLMAVFSIVIVSPGADFLLVLRQSVVHGRRAAVITGLGIGASLLFHISYAILGLGLIVSKSLFLFSLLKWAGAAYLLYLGVTSLRAKAFELPSAEISPDAGEHTSVSTVRCFLMGFVTNALNPKPVLFFLSLFSALVSHETPAAVQGVYGLLMATALVIWFVGVPSFFTITSVRERFISCGRWFNKVTGVVLIGLLATQQAN